jgi:hypothetical protein
MCLFVLALLAAAMVGGYLGLPQQSISQSNVTAPNWANCALGKRKCTTSPMQNNQSINQSLSNASKSSINQSILSTFKFMK